MFEMPERRQSQRHRMLKSGAISYGRFNNIDCLIRNLSRHGACLELVSPIATPAAFTLTIKGNPMQLSCKAVWRSGKKIGVRFA
jgi:hypothetical protein